MEILQLEYFGVVLYKWLFSFGIFWALLRVFNIGLIQFIDNKFDNYRASIYINPVDCLFSKEISILLNFLFGLPKTIILLAYGLVIAIILAWLLFFAVVTVFIPWAIRSAFL
ncbi:hypothetical protein KAJ89_01855 [Candidatus Parcubacteria bacterium]|nr:hypothetical protein [Candidatus Parcubacteria bacterium]